ncbi:MAG: biotin/lipoyl-binding protein [Solirubrobacterales bacterium]|nr:biotin/lipoyl-binding protein [Solirubrobacterales bacterium]
MGTTHRITPRWLNLTLAVGALALLVVAILLVGPSSQPAGAQSRVVTAQHGVVQSTVSGSGTIEPATELDLGFKAAGAVRQIFVSQGQHVVSGQLLAELDPRSAEVTLEQARATLRAAEATLAQDRESTSRSTAPQGSAGRGSANRGSANRGSGRAGAAARGNAPTTAREARGGGAASNEPAESAATREATIASGNAAVKSDRLAVQSAEDALAGTRLYAPTAGTIVSLGGEVGETVAGNGTTRDQSAAGSSGAGGSGAGAGAGGSSGAGRGGSGAGSGEGSAGRSGSSTGGAGSGSGSGSGFAVLADLEQMQVVAPLSESEIVRVHDNQTATVTVEALEGAKLAAHVESVATLPTSNSGVVSYDVTFQLDQLAPGLRPGMSASAEVVVQQEEGVTVPSSAISGGTVTVVRDGRDVRVPVVTGLAGASSTIVLSGLRAGEAIVLPLARATNPLAGIAARLGAGAGGRLGAGAGVGVGAGGRLGAGGALGGGGGIFGADAAVTRRCPGGRPFRQSGYCDRETQVLKKRKS